MALPNRLKVHEAITKLHVAWLCGLGGACLEFVNNHLGMADPDYTVLLTEKYELGKADARQLAISEPPWAFIEHWLQERDNALSQGEWKLAESIRDELLRLGIGITDAGGRSGWYRVPKRK